jgi:hypothetical protein
MSELANAPESSSVSALTELLRPGTAALLLNKTLVVCGAVILWPRLFRARTSPSSLGCIANLQTLEGAKQTWALERNKSTNDTPTWEEVKPYFKGVLSCPNGGVYTLGRVGAPPQCSLGGSGHTVPH